MSEISSFIRTQLFDNHVVLITDRTWVFSEPIEIDAPIWPIIDQIFFKNNPRIQNLIFAVPYWVAQFRIESLFSEVSYLRVLIIYGSDLSVTMRAINQFMALHTQVVAKVIPKNHDWSGFFIDKTINASLRGNYKFSEAKFFRYQKAHHHTLPGEWYLLDDTDMQSVTPHFLMNKIQST